MIKFLRAFAFVLLFMVLHIIIQAVIMNVYINITESALLPASGEASSDLSSVNIGQISLIASFISFLAFILVFKMRGKNLFSACKFTKSSSVKSLSYGLMFGLSSNFVISIIMGLLMEIRLFDNVFRQYEDHISFMMFRGDILFPLLGIGIITPIVEELIFRGAIISELETILSSKVVVLIQGLLFGAFHLDVVQGAYTAVIGVFLGYMVYKTGSIWPAVAAHIALNTLGVFLTIPEGLDFVEKYNNVILAVLLISFAMSIVYFIKLPRKASVGDSSIKA